MLDTLLISAPEIEKYFFSFPFLRISHSKLSANGIGIYGIAKDVYIFKLYIFILSLALKKIHINFDKIRKRKILLNDFFLILVRIEQKIVTIDSSVLMLSHHQSANQETLRDFNSSYFSHRCAQIILMTSYLHIILKPHSVKSCSAHD